MTSLTFYGGVSEIGGNKILLEDKGARIYLDFGQSFDFGTDYFYDYLAPRTANGLEVYFEFGLVPRVPKLYSRKMLQFTDLKYEKPDIDAILISHSHSDHINHLQFVDEDVPVYMGHGTHHIYEAYHRMYASFYDIGEHSDIRLFKSGDKIRVKHLVVEPVHVEHSVPGAYGFIIHTSSGPVVYTGDFRLHGPQSWMTQEFIKKAAAAKPRALICEGTRIGSEAEHNYTEQEVEAKASQIIKGAKGLVFSDFSMSNVDRFMSFYNAAVANGRKLVVDTRFAYILRCLREKVPVLPDVMTDRNLLVYFRICKSCTFSEKDYYPWDRDYFHKMITYRELAKSGPKYVMHMGFNRLMELVYIQSRGADFIWSMSEHFLEGEDNEDTKRVLENWLRHFGITLHKAHCSGHASPEDIAGAIKSINPELLIPIHTNNPNDFKGLHGKVAILEKGKTVEI